MASIIFGKTKPSANHNAILQNDIIPQPAMFAHHRMHDKKVASIFTLER
jgi:hypothetical protein